MADETEIRAIGLLDRLLDRFDTRAFIAVELTTSMVILTFVLAMKVPESDAFKILLGAMLTVGFASAVGWYFNSSAGSEKKDTAQAKVTEKLADKVVGTGNGMAAAVAAAALAAPAAAAVAAPAAAAIAAPPAAAVAAPPVVEEVVPPAVEKAVADAMAAAQALANKEKDHAKD